MDAENGAKIDMKDSIHRGSTYSPPRKQQKTSFELLASKLPLYASIYNPCLRQQKAHWIFGIVLGILILSAIIVVPIFVTQINSTATTTETTKITEATEATETMATTGLLLSSTTTETSTTSTASNSPYKGSGKPSNLILSFLDS